MKEAERRKEKEVTPARFTEYMAEAHNQQSFDQIMMQELEVEPEMEGKIERYIRKGKANKVVGADGVHV